MATLSPIPQPPTVPFLANVPLLDVHLPIKSFRQLAQQYGEIYQFQFPSGRIVLHINSQPILAQISDDKHFKKVVSGPLEEVRNLARDGLFTAHLEEPNWGKAHRILMPAFGAGNVRNMYDGMKDICSQLLLKWERFGSDHEIDPADDFTRLTFDTIGYCAMSYRFNSFYEKSLPKFVQDMGDVLIESNNRAFRSPFAKAVPLFNRSADAKYFADIKDMIDTGNEIVKKRRANPQASKDVLTMMLEGRDPQTGEGLSDDAIMYNLLTFLIAGHETTSGMLTFTVYHLLKNPNSLIKLRQEVDHVVGTGDIQLEHLDKMPYLVAVMRESLRLSPTATARTVAAREDVEIIGGDGDALNPANKKYAIKNGVPIVAHTHQTQMDPRCWGENAELFQPERMLDGKFDAMPPQAWQPFGFGLRGCIGRLFAWQEAQLVLASIIQKFDLVLADPSYSLEIKQTLTIKPKNLRIHARLRSDPSFASYTPQTSAPTATTVAALANATITPTALGGGPLYVFYGSNTGSSESFAGRLASDAAAHGFAAKIAILDSATGHLPADGPVVIVTASFEGEPADNAAQFVSWLESLPGEGSDGLLKGVNFAVFGCGNREWARTYQRIPTLIYQTLEKNGAARLMDRGEGDAASASFFQSFDDWEAKLWVALAEKYGGAKAISATAPSILADTFEVNVIDAGTGRAKMLRQQDAAMGTVVENRCLTREGVPEKRHIEIKLPDDMSYRAGDYLAILPTNPPEIVERVLAYFKLAVDKEIVIKADGPTALPNGYPVPCKELLGGYVELTQPATSRDISALQAFAESEAIISSLKTLRDNFENAVLAKRLSIVDILESHADINLPFSQFLRLLPPMRVRQYSISSSSLVNPSQVSLTISVLDAPARSDTGKRHLGIASNYLARLAAGDKVPVVVRPSAAAFHLPSDPLVPVVMTCAGSGLAPFRGFIEERAAQKAAGRDVGKTILFFGCRAPEDDYLYAETDLKTWSEQGVVDIRPAFSRKSEACHGCKYAQDRMWLDREEIIKLTSEGAKFYTCGSRGLSTGVTKICLDLVKHAHPELDESAATELLERIQKARFASDIFD